jgi:hypothetical protein
VATMVSAAIMMTAVAARQAPISDMTTVILLNSSGYLFICLRRYNLLAPAKMRMPI